MKEYEINAGAILFKKRIPIVVELEGNVDGHVFSIRGKGHGDASIGTSETHNISKTGDLPVAWASLASSIGYGLLCFTKYPNDKEDFFKDCMPEGYIQERTITFENDGMYKTRAEVTYENGTIYNRIKLTGEGFRKDGNILGKKLKLTSKPSTMVVLPDEKNNAVTTRFHVVHDVIGGGFQVAAYIQRNTYMSEGPVNMPQFHQIRPIAILSNDPKRKVDNMKMREITTAEYLQK